VLASYFGFNALSLAIGGAVGQLLGGWLYDIGQRHDATYLPWLTMSAVGVVVVASLAAFARTRGAGRLNLQPA
jgi:MFS transporter, DHA1 family, multidrug resistance protein